MTKDLIIIALGLWVAVLPFLGLPNAWDRVVLIVSGFSVSILMYLLRRDFYAYVERLERRRGTRRYADTYVESGTREEPSSAALAHSGVKRSPRPAPPLSYAHAKESSESVS